jgi:hypothetical protein
MKTMEQFIKQKTANVTEAGSIPLAHAGICWNLERERRPGEPIEDLTVVNFGDGGREDPRWRAAVSTDGACMLEWKEGRNPRHTPLGMFAEMCFDGTIPRGMGFDRLLKEFAKIEGCDWALQMLAALRMGQFLMGDDEEHTIG